MCVYYFLIKRKKLFEQPNTCCNTHNILIGELSPLILPVSGYGFVLSIQTNTVLFFLSAQARFYSIISIRHGSDTVIRSRKILFRSSTQTQSHFSCPLTYSFILPVKSGTAPVHSFVQMFHFIVMETNFHPVHSTVLIKVSLQPVVCHSNPWNNRIFSTRPKS